MIHPVVMLAASGAGSSYTITYNPVGGQFQNPPNHVNVTITITGGSKFRWKLDSGAWTTVTGTSTTVNVVMNGNGVTLYTDILDGNNNVLFSKSDVYTLIF